MKYPKLTFLIFTYVLAIFLFKGRVYLEFLSNLGYIGTFFSGIFYDYGLTSGIAAAMLMILAKSQNLIIALFIAVFGAMIGDFIIFEFFKYSFKEELMKLKKEKIFAYFEGRMPKSFMFILSCFVIASPLPDEIGVFLMASTKKFSNLTFIILSFFLHLVGIYALLQIGRLL